MIYVYIVGGESYKFKNDQLAKAIEWLELWCGIRDFGGMNEALETEGAWYNDGERAAIEINRDYRELSNVEYLPI